MKSVCVCVCAEDSIGYDVARSKLYEVLVHTHTMNKYMKLDDSSRLNFGQMFRVRPEPNSMMATVVRYLLIVANSLILADAIFLLISEKDEYQGQFIKGRHPVSKYLLLMLYLDIQSFLLIIYGVLGIVGKYCQCCCCDNNRYSSWMLFL